MKPEKLETQEVDLENSALFDAYLFASTGRYYRQNNEFFKAGSVDDTVIFVTFVDHGETARAAFIDRLSGGVWSGFHLPHHADLLELLPRRYPDLSLNAEVYVDYVRAHRKYPNPEELSEIALELSRLADEVRSPDSNTIKT